MCRRQVQRFVTRTTSGARRERGIARLLRPQKARRWPARVRFGKPGGEEHSREHRRAWADLDPADSLDLWQRMSGDVRRRRAARPTGAARGSGAERCLSRLRRRVIHEGASAASERRFGDQRVSSR